MPDIIDIFAIDYDAFRHAVDAATPMLLPLMLTPLPYALMPLITPDFSLRDAAAALLRFDAAAISLRLMLMLLAAASRHAAATPPDCAMLSQMLPITPCATR